MRKKTWIWLLLTAVAVVLVLGVTGFVQFKGRAVTEQAELFVGSHATYEEVVDSLMPRMRHRAAFHRYARRINLPETFKAGHYLLKPGMNVIEVARMLKLGLQTPVRVTINNVRTPAQLAGKLARQLDADSAALLRVVTSERVARELGFDSVTLFSMFIPDTYELWWTTTPEELVRRMKQEYDRFWTPVRDAKRKRSGLSRLEVMTLASIVYEETRKTDEMPRIAGVYINRLRRGIPLQADPTVKYALQDFTLRRILHRHLKTQSPYNTYIHRGLPPSPICMPGKNAIDAVLDFEQHDYIFFCARRHSTATTTSRGRCVSTTPTPGPTPRSSTAAKSGRPAAALRRLPGGFPCHVLPRRAFPAALPHRTGVRFGRPASAPDEPNDVPDGRIGAERW